MTPDAGPPANLLTDLNEAFPMIGGPGAAEASTVNGYTFNRSGTVGGSLTDMGGPARPFVGAGRLNALVDDAFIGRIGNYSKAVAFRPTSLSGQQIIYGALTAGGQPSWLIRTNNDDLEITWGDTVGTNGTSTIYPSLGVGLPYVISFSFNRSVGIARVFLNGVLIGNFGSLPIPTGAGALNGFIGGWTGGQEFSGNIAVPTGWTRSLLDAEHVQFYNAGAPWRL